MDSGVMPERPPPATEYDRRKAYHLRVEMGYAWSYVESKMNYSQREMSRWIKRYKEEGTFRSVREVKKTIGKTRTMRSLSLVAQNSMISVVCSKRSIYYKDVQYSVWLRTGEVASVSAIKAACLAYGLTSKVATTYSLHRDRDAMRTHAQLRSRYLQRQLLFVDECHKNGKEFGRKYAKALKGERAYVPLAWQVGKAFTVLAAMDETGLVARKVQQLATGAAESHLPKALTRQLWLAMFKEAVLPTLNPADSRRLPRSVVVIDNCSLHWGNDIDDPEQHMQFVNQLHALIKSREFTCPRTGRTVTPKLCYTPPYCPRANAIEAMFKAMNDYIRTHANGVSKTHPKQAIENGLLSVTCETATKLVRQSCLDVHSWL